MCSLSNKSIISHKIILSNDSSYSLITNTRWIAGEVVPRPRIPTFPSSELFGRVWFLFSNLHKMSLLCDTFQLAPTLHLTLSGSVEKSPSALYSGVKEAAKLYGILLHILISVSEPKYYFHFISPLNRERLLQISSKKIKSIITTLLIMIHY